MPSLRHWVATPALTYAVINAVGVLLGLLGVQSLLPEWQFWGLVIIGVVATLSAWRLAATTSSDTEQAKTEANQAATEAFKRENALKEKIDELLYHITANADQAQPNTTVEDLRSVTTEALRRRVLKITTQMRTTQRAYDDARDRIMYDRSVDWEQQTSKLIAHSRESNFRWRSELHPEAFALWQEMLRRIYGAPPYPKDEMHRTIALEQGMLAGAHPLHHAALVLEELARELPS